MKHTANLKGYIGSPTSVPINITEVSLGQFVENFHHDGVDVFRVGYFTGSVHPTDAGPAAGGSALGIGARSLTRLGD